ncbi:hypothetical protein DSO57_1030562 [Entomophthora muscae]|uniref:Uncharacterized protein n=1 Tax=Entomophthora muscae TaxID=34485 RepID=A0ACC2TCY4_9FUNG|nr:hypothetical protein DSO57_1030562 [Entomophthora muscae]
MFDLSVGFQVQSPSREEIPDKDPLARSTEFTRYNQKDPWYVTEPRLFRDKYNFLPAYQMDMEPPITPKPMPTSATKIPLDHTNKLFGIMYIILTVKTAGLTRQQGSNQAGL